MQNLDIISVCVCMCVFFLGPLNASFSCICHLHELQSKINSNTVEQEKDFYEGCKRNGHQFNERERFRELFYEPLRGSLVQLVGWRRYRHTNASSEGSEGSSIGFCWW